MKRVLEILSYASQVLSAITEGAKVAADKWPTSNPFSTTKPPESTGSEIK